MYLRLPHTLANQHAALPLKGIPMSMKHVHQDRYDTPALTRAIEIWESGRAISLTLFAALTADGYDVPSLERRYRK